MQAAGRRAASDVHGLLLGRQQSVHGRGHRLHVNLRADGMAVGLRPGAVWALPPMGLGAGGQRL